MSDYREILALFSSIQTQIAESVTLSQGYRLSFLNFVRCAKVVKTIATKIVYSLSIVVDCSETFSMFKKPKGC